MNWVDLERRVYQATKSAFSSLKNTCPDEEFYVFALYTDSGAMTICPSANSLNGLQDKINQEDEEDRSAEVVQYYKWASSEWAYEARGSEEFQDICKSLRESEEWSDFENFQSQVFLTMTNALLSLKNEGFFTSFKTQQFPVLFVTITDDNRAEEVENKSAKILNGEPVLNKFLSRYDDV